MILTYFQWEALKNYFKIDGYPIKRLLLFRNGISTVQLKPNKIQIIVFSRKDLKNYKIM